MTDLRALAADLRLPRTCRVGKSGTVDNHDHQPDATDKAAADVIDACAPLDDTRPTCPTCGGSRMVDKRSGKRPDFEQSIIGVPCPDCTDGRVPLARWIEQLVALWNAAQEQTAFYDWLTNKLDHPDPEAGERLRRFLDKPTILDVQP